MYCSSIFRKRKGWIWREYLSIFLCLLIVTTNVMNVRVDAATSVYATEGIGNESGLSSFTEDENANVSKSVYGNYEDSVTGSTYQNPLVDLRVTADTTPPVTTLTIQGSGTGTTYYGAIIISLSAVDATSGVNYSEYSLDGGTVWNRCTGPITLSEIKTYNFKYRSVDNSNNVETAKSQKITIKADTTAPVTTMKVSGTKGSNNYFTSAVEIILTSTDDYSGVKQTQYSLDNGVTWTPYTTPVSLIKEGLNTVQYRAEDTSSNIEIAKSSKIYIDTIKPTNPTVIMDPNEWTSDSVKLSIYDGYDNGSGVSKTQYSLDLNGEWLDYSVPLTFNTATDISVKTIDMAGNESEVVKQHIKIDQTAPDSPTIELDANNWTNKTVYFKVIAGADSDSGIRKSEFRVGDSGPWSAYVGPDKVAGEGITTLYARSIDKAGNISSEASAAIKIDYTPPSSPIISKDSSEWTNTEVKVDIINGTDELSGVEVSQYRIGENGEWLNYSGSVIVSVEGITKLYARTIDKAGNISLESSVTIKIDKTAPTSPSIALTESGWTKNAVKATITSGTDALSGVLKSQYRIDESGEWKDYTAFVTMDTEGITSLYARTLDVAGNISIVSVAYSKIDRTPPTVPGTVILNAKNPTSANIAWGISTDNLSKIQYEIYADGTYVNSYNTATAMVKSLSVNTYHMLKVRAKDEAGNNSDFTAPLEVLTNRPIVSKYYNTLMLKPDGTVWAWGMNQFGQVGDGTFDNVKTTAGQVKELDSIVAVSVGGTKSGFYDIKYNNFSLALKRDGTVWAWGINSENQLGDGTTTNRSLPTQVIGLNSVIAITAGSTESYAIKEDGTIWGWGNGQPLHQINTTVTDAIDIQGNFILKKDGTVWDVSNPAHYVNIDHVVSLSSTFHSLALRSDGTVWGWGRNNSCELGTQCSNTSITQPVQIPGLADITEVVATTDAVNYTNYSEGISYAINSRGQLWQWGKHYELLQEGSLIYLKLTYINNPQLHNLQNVMTLSSEGITMDFMKNDGTAWTWGGYGRGVEAYNSAYIPNPIPLVYNYKPVVEIFNARGTSNNPRLLSIVDNQVSWHHIDSPLATFTAYQVQVLNDSGSQVLYDSGINNIILSTQAWNYLLDVGLLPENVTMQFRVRVKDADDAWSDWSTPEWIRRDTTLVTEGQVISTHNHSLMLKKDGTVWAWGNNDNGQLGDGTTVTRLTPVQVVGLDHIVYIKSSDGQDTAIKSDGSLWKWGKGAGANGTEVTTPFKVSDYQYSNNIFYKPDGKIFRVVQDIGEYILTDAGGVFPKELGNYHYREPLIKDVVSMKRGVRPFQASYYVFLKSDGTVWVYKTVIETPNEVKYEMHMVEGLANIKQIFVDNENLTALDGNGAIWQWGRYTALNNYNGSVNVVGSSDTSVPIMYTTTSGFKTFSSNEAYHSLAYKSDNEIYSWGANNSGELGDGTTTPSMLTRVSRTPLVMPVIEANIHQSDVVLGWGAIPAAIKYIVKVDGNVVGNTTETSYTLNGLTPGIQHVFEVQAQSGDNTSGWGKLSQYTLPDTVANIAVDPTSSSMKLNWGAVVGATGYDVEFDGEIAAAAANTFIKSGLSANTSHSIRVRAKNSIGAGNWSSTVTGSTLLNTPIATSASTASSVTLSWNVVPDATGYVIKADDRTIIIGSTTTYTDSGLSPNTRHSYQIQAKTASNASAWSELLSTYTTPATPSVTMTSNTTTLYLTWQAVQGASGYDVEVDGELAAVTGLSYNKAGFAPNTSHPIRIRAKNSYGAGDWTAMLNGLTKLITPVLTSSSTSYAITLNWSSISGAQSYKIKVDGNEVSVGNVSTYVHTGLYQNTRHTYQIQALSTNNSSLWSGDFNASTLVVTTGLPVVVYTSSTLAISWSPVSEATGYDLEIDGVVIPLTASSYTKTGLTANSLHTVRVRWKNNSGAMDWTDAVTGTTLLETPVLAATSTDSIITVTWAVVSGATSYLVTADGVVVDNGNNVSYTHATLTPNTSHTYMVQAISEGNSSVRSTVLTKSTASAVPANPTITSTTSSLALSWTAVTGATGYDVEFDGAVTSVTTASFTKTGLAANTGHTIRIRSKNSNGNSDWGTMVTSYTQLAAPAFSTVTASNTITLSWNSISGATGYSLLKDGQVLSVGAATSYTDMGLASNSTHSYQVKAVNATTSSEWSTIISKTTSPGIPAITSLTPSANSVAVTWQASTGATGYDLEFNGVVTAVTGTSYTKTGLSSGASLAIRIRSKNSSTASEWSQTYSTGTKPTIPVITAVSTSTAITISWSTVSGATSYNVKIDGNSYNVTNTSFIIGGFAASSHTYQVQAVSAYGTSDWSTLTTRYICPVTPNTPYLVPTASSISASWTAVTGATGYDLEIDGVVVSVSGTSYVKSGLASKTGHTFRVRSKNSGGTSDWSSPAVMRTL